MKTTPALALLSLLLTHPAAAAAPYDPATGGYRQLFLDDYRIESLRDVERVVHPGKKAPAPVLTADRPWEKDAVYVYGTALFDEEEGLFKLWYQTFYKKPPDAYMLYATSVDGIRWEKPSLGVVEWNGSKENNIVLKGEIGTVVKDAGAADPARRYKMLVFQRPGYHAYFSPDGVKWTPSLSNPVIPQGDVSNVTFDPRSGRFAAVTKQPHPQGRAAFLSWSDDFERWTTPTVVLTADRRDQSLAEARGATRAEIYGMAAAPWEGVYLGFPWMFHVTGKGARDTGGDGGIDVQLAVSRDMTSWTRQLRDPVLPRGVAGSFDDEMIFTSSAPVVRGDEILLYYGAWDGPHGTFDRKAAVGLAKWRRDGFVSLSNGGHSAGEMVSKPLLLDGGELRVNAAFLGAGSSLRAEVAGLDSQPLPGWRLEECVAFSGDSTDAALTWRGGRSLKELAGRTVRLRFRLTGGDLYSFRLAR